MEKKDFKEKYKKVKKYSKEEEMDLIIKSINTAESVRFRGERNLLICTEELAELQQCLIKYIRNKGDRINTIEEIADVCLGIEYIKEILNISDDEIDKAKAVKLDRLKEKLESEGTFK